MGEVVRDVINLVYYQHGTDKQKFLNIKICNRRKITLPKASDSSFSNCPCSSSFKFFYVVLSILNTINFHLSGCFLLSLKTSLKKCKYTEKWVYRVLKYTTISYESTVNGI